MWNYLLRCIPRPWRAHFSGPVAQRFVKGMFWSLIGALATKGFSVAAYMLLARTLGQEEFGQFGMVLSTTVLFQSFASFGTALTATKYVAEYRTTDPLRAGRIIGLSNLLAWCFGALFALLLVGLGPWIAQRFLNAPALAPLLQIGAVAIFFQATNGAQMGVLCGLEAFRSLAVGNILMGLLTPTLLLLGVWVDGLRGCVCASTVSFGLMCLVFQWFTRRELLRHHLSACYAGLRQEAPLLWKFSLPSLFMGLMVDPIGWICNAMLVNQPNGYREMSLIGATSSWKNIVFFVPNTVGRVLLPMLSNLQGHGERRKTRKLFMLNVAVNLALALGVAVPVILFAPWIMAGYGIGFRVGVPVLIVGMLSAVFICLSNAAGTALLSAGHLWLSFGLNLLWAAVLLGGAWMWIPGHGALGQALAFLVAYAILSMAALALSLSLFHKAEQA
jgi:O-antigen/teichoic acid export membrane protein